MPDSKKISRMGTKDDMEMIKEDTEEFLSLLSDSEASVSSSKSPGISPAHSSLTLEQFTNIVLAKEKFDTLNGASEIPVTVDEIVDPVPTVSRASKQVILPKTLASHPFSSIHSKQTTAGEKLKPVVLTPRQVHFQTTPSPAPPRPGKLGLNTLKLLPSPKPNQLSLTAKAKSTKVLPLYESIFSLAGSPGAQKNNNVLMPELHLTSPSLDQRDNDQIRKQLESVIKKNEDILNNTDLVMQDALKRKDKSFDGIDNSTPLNLSVRKDLMKPSEQTNSLVVKRNPKSIGSLPEDLSQTVASLITKTGGDLEITRKVKKIGPPLKSIVYNTPASVNLTPIYRPKASNKDSLQTGSNDSILGKRKGDSNNDGTTDYAKKMKQIAEEIKPEITPTETGKPKEEYSPLVNKITLDCKFALQQDLHGNFPIHNAVLLSNLNLVKRFSLVLAALKKSVDLVNTNGLTPLHLALEQNNPVLVGELLHYGASPLVTTRTGCTCYHLAVQYGDGQSLGVLLKHVPDRQEVNLFNDQGQTALHLALISENEAMVKMLLAYGAKPDVQELRSGKTGLLMALEHGNQNLAELLVCYGASMSISSWGGVTPASICAENKKQSDQGN